jgi:F-type H+-transporting ATPase subunit delta
MNEGLISKRYARALLEFSTERGEDKGLYERMRSLSRSIAASQRLRDALLTPVLSLRDKTQLVYGAAGEGDMEFSFRRFVAIVVNNHRERLLQNIALGYMQLYRRVHRISVVNLVSVKPMSEYALERIRLDVARRTHGSVELETHVDESIKGGFIFQIDDLRLDASVAGQLEKVRRQFIRKNRIII